MSASWNEYGGNFGGLNLCCVQNKFQVLAEDCEEEIQDQTQTNYHEPYTIGDAMTRPRGPS